MPANGSYVAALITTLIQLQIITVNGINLFGETRKTQCAGGTAGI